MFLRSLTIKGFKSFADPVTIDLSPGVSVIVGPNGSGKSNIADAIAWVLGAQGPKTVRSSKMDEVIFAGAGRRGPLGRAEVSIVIDNSDHGLELDLSEVTVTRTLFRSGDSEYSLNGNPCRLIDLQDLLSDAGVGRQQHVIISQGQLDMILNARPEERREVVEEAAGIAKFRKRRERTERRLASMEGDLLRAGDLVREVKRQIKPLAQQAVKAKRQLELRDRITQLKRYIAGSEVRALEDGAEALGREQIDAEGRLLSLQSEIAAVDQAIASWESERPQVGADDLFDLTTRSEAICERLRSTLDIAQQKRESLSERLRASDRSGQIESLHVELNSLKAEVESTEEQIVELDSELGELEAEEANFRLEETPEIAEKLQSLNVRFNEFTHENGQMLSQRSALRETLNRIKPQLQGLELRKGRLREQSAAKSAEAERVKERISELIQLREQQGEGHMVQSDALRDLNERLERVSSAHSGHEVAVNSLRAQVSAYESAIEDGRSRTQAKALSRLSGFVGAIVDIIEIKSGYELAFSAAVQGLASSVLTKDLDSAFDGIRYLKSNGLEGSIIPITHYTGSFGMAEDHPSLPFIPLRAQISTVGTGLEKFLDLILRNTFVVRSSLDEAIEYHRRFPQLVFVTTDGERLGPDGFWTASRPMQGTGLALERALSELSDAEREHENSGSELRHLRDLYREASLKSEAMREEMEAIREELARLESLPERLARDIEEGLIEIEALEVEERGLRDREESAEKQVSALELDLSHHGRLLESLETEIGQLQLKMKDQFAKRKELDKRAVDLEIRAAKLEQTRVGLERARGVAESRLLREVATQDSSQSELAVWKRAVVGLDHVIERSSIVLGVASELAGEAKRLRLHLIEAARFRSERLNDARTRRSQLEAELEAKREALQLSAIRRSEARVRLETMGERIRRELSIEVEIAKSTPIPEGVYPAEAELVLRQLEEELSRLGPINELAEIELAELTEKLEFLDTQLDDVKASRRELGKVIRSIDSEILQLFQGAINDVTENFSILFDQLFQGGKGRLVLSDPNEPLASGLDIEVTLPGKSVKRLSLLSGGERSLVALAFLFSIFESRPSPFYILDEVEAALDDINLNRFLKLITSFGKSSQLLIISHQKRTMEVADLLYGVTMQEGGSTKVVSQRMSQVAANAQ